MKTEIEGEEEEKCNKELGGEMSHGRQVLQAMVQKAFTKEKNQRHNRCYRGVM